MKTRCFVVGAGEYTGMVTPGQGDYLIAADGGYAKMASLGILPDLVVGDFDSLGAVPDHPNVMQSPAEKDDTDMMLAVRQGLERGYTTFLIDGGLDGRIDHTIANFQILAYLAQSGARGVLLGREMCVTAVTDGIVRFLPGRAAPGDGLAERISVFCWGDTAKGVTLTGLKYRLENAKLECSYPLGVSNEFTQAPASITVRGGTLIIAWTGGIGRMEAVDS